MKIMRAMLVCACLLLGLGAEADANHPPLPADADINEDAGRGNLLFVTLRLETGEELPFILDTGSPVTLIDTSLIPKLGKRLDTATVAMLGGEQETGIYAAPRLYLGNMPLMTGSNVISYDCRRLTSYRGRRARGILGMDCLVHYCVQLDFEAGKLRFLEPGKMDVSGLGNAFALTYSSEEQSDRHLIRPFIHHAGLLGGKRMDSLIDTGCNYDGRVERGVIKGHYGTRFIHFMVRSRSMRLPGCVWDGQAYTHLRVGAGKDANLLGLRFLARHLVTLDFPNLVMYLKQTRDGPLTK